MFSMTCTNKGCGKTQQPYIDLKDDKVYCAECDKEITNVTYFTKVQMKNLKQVKVKSVTSFSVKCGKCGRDGRPKILNNDVVCNTCSSPLDHLSLPFKNMLKENLKKINQDI